MGTIVPASTIGTAIPQSDKSHAGSIASNAANSSAPAGSAGAKSAADSVALSDSARHSLEQMKAAKAALDDIPKSLDEIVERKVQAFTDKLLVALDGAKFRFDDKLALKVDRFGNVTAEGFQKEKVEKMFRDNPELAREFKDIAGLEELRAADKAMKLFIEEKRGAVSEEDRERAQTLFNIRLRHIHALSGHFVLEDSKLVSAAGLYADGMGTRNDPLLKQGRADLRA